MKVGIKKSAYTSFLMIILILLGINIICVNWFKLDEFINSDIVAEMSYFELVWETKNLIPFEWVNSQELFISRPGLIGAIIYGLTNNLIVSYKISLIITTILICGSMAYFLKQLKINNQNIMVAIICLIGLFYSEIIKVTILFLNAYSMFLVVTFFTLGVYVKIRINKEEIRYKILTVSTLIIFAFVMGISGPRLTLVLYLPLILLECWEIFKERDNSKFNLNIRYIYYSFGLLLANVVGFFVYKIYIIDLIGHTEISKFTILPLNQILDNLKESLVVFLNSYGIYGGVELLSLVGIDFCIKSMLILIFGIAIYWLFKKGNGSVKKILSFFMMSLSLTCLYQIGFMDVQEGRYYFLSVFFGVVLIGLTLEYIIFNDKLIKYFFVGFLIIGVSINILSNYLPMYRSEGNRVYKEITNYLVDNNFNKAYATYWNADILKGLSNNKIKTGHFTSELKPYMWLTDKRMYEETNKEDGDKIAIILTDKEEEELFNSHNRYLLEQLLKIQEIEEYNIYEAFVNPIVITELPKEINEIKMYSFAQNYAIKEVEEINLNENYVVSDIKGGYIAWGPYIETIPGEYKFTLNYESVISQQEEIGFFEIAVNGESISQIPLKSKDKQVG